MKKIHVEEAIEKEEEDVVPRDATRGYPAEKKIDRRASQSQPTLLNSSWRSRQSCNHAHKADPLLSCPRLLLTRGPLGGKEGGRSPLRGREDSRLKS